MWSRRIRMINTFTHSFCEYNIHAGWHMVEVRKKFINNLLHRR